MEARNIIIIESRNQNKTVINSTATTLRELKQDLDKHNIDYEGMAFYEGISKTEIKVDDSVLPHNIPYRGTTTNELVFMLTNPVKKIKSGSMTRTEILNKIKEYGLQQKVKDTFDKNATNVTSVGLLRIIEQYENYMKEEAKEVNKEVVNSISSTSNNNDSRSIYVEKTLLALIDILYNNNILNREEVDRLKGLPKESFECSYSDKELDNMFDFLTE